MGVLLRGGLTLASLEPAPTHDSRREEDVPAASVVEHAGRSEGWIGARAPRESQLEDTTLVALVEDSRARGRYDPRIGQEPVGTTLPPAEVKEHGSQSGSGPQRAGASRSGSAFRVVPLATRYVFLHFLLVLCWLSFLLECD